LEGRFTEAGLAAEAAIVGHAKAYLPKLDWPIRCGFHPESAFPLGQIVDYARGVGDGEFETLLLLLSGQFYNRDRDYPVRYEPSGNDFFSPGLNEADLMRRVLGREDFGKWLEGFFPGLGKGRNTQCRTSNVQFPRGDRVPPLGALPGHGAPNVEWGKEGAKSGGGAEGTVIGLWRWLLSVHGVG